MAWDQLARIELCEAIQHVKKYGQGNIVLSGEVPKNSRIVWKQVHDHLVSVRQGKAAPPSAAALKQEWSRMLIQLAAYVQVEQTLGSGWPPKAHDETFFEYFQRVGEDGSFFKTVVVVLLVLIN